MGSTKRWRLLAAGAAAAAAVLAPVTIASAQTTSTSTPVGTSSTSSSTTSTSAPVGTSSTLPPTTSTTIDPTICPGGPECVGFDVSPTSGPAGTVVTVHAVSGLCTEVTGFTLVSETAPPTVASGILDSFGAGNAYGTLTIPAGTPPGAYSIGMELPGNNPCVASFTVTASTTPAVIVQPGLTG